MIYSNLTGTGKERKGRFFVSNSARLWKGLNYFLTDYFTDFTRISHVHNKYIESFQMNFCLTHFEWVQFNTHPSKPNSTVLERTMEKRSADMAGTDALSAAEQKKSVIPLTKQIFCFCVCVCVIFSFIKFLKKRNETILILCIVFFVLFCKYLVHPFAKRNEMRPFWVLPQNLFALRTQNKNTLLEIIYLKSGETNV